MMKHRYSLATAALALAIHPASAAMITGDIDPDAGVPTAGATFEDTFVNGIDQSKWGFNYPYENACNNGLPGLGNNDPNNNTGYVSPNCSSQANAGVFITGPNGLDIVAKPAPAGVNDGGKPYVSGQIYSKQTFQYGYFEATTKLPGTTGIGAAFWLFPADGSGTYSELDVEESLGEDPSTIYSTIHDGSNQQEQTATDVPGGVQNRFHSYGVNWQADTTTFYLDGVATKSYATPDSMRKPMYMILGSGTQSGWGQPVGPRTQFPADFQIKDVRVLPKSPY